MKWCFLAAIAAAGMVWAGTDGGCQIAAAPAGKAPIDEDLGVLAAERWVGRALILRGFWAGDDLKYDADGRPVDPGKVTDWTLAGFDLEKVKRRTDGELELDGLRVAARWNPDQRIFERHLLKAETMKIVFPAPSAPRVEAALAAMFSVGIDPALQRSMPPYWSHYFIPAMAWPADAISGKTVFGLASKPPEGLVFPAVVKKGEPAYTPEATLDHVRGTVRVGLDVDENGIPQRVVIRQPLGYGLDKATVDAVEKYTFRPGTINGVPAVVEVVVNQGFD